MKKNYLSNFKKTKEVGNSFGRVYEKKGHKFRVRSALKKNPDEKNELKRRQKYEVLREYLAGSLYKKILGESVPDIILIEGNKEDENIYVGSKYIENFQSLGEFIEKNGKDLSQIKGLEHLMAASLLLGDKLNDRNIGVVTKNSKKRTNYEFAKINHGEAFTFYPPEALIKRVDSILEDFRNKGIHLAFDVLKFKKAIEETPTKILYEIKIPGLKNLNLKDVISRLEDLKKTGCELLDLQGDQKIEQAISKKKIESFIEKNCAGQLDLFEKLPKTLDNVIKRTSTSEISGRWIKSLIDNPKKFESTSLLTKFKPAFLSKKSKKLQPVSPVLYEEPMDTIPSNNEQSTHLMEEVSQKKLQKLKSHFKDSLIY